MRSGVGGVAWACTNAGKNMVPLSNAQVTRTIDSSGAKGIANGGKLKRLRGPGQRNGVREARRGNVVRMRIVVVPDVHEDVIAASAHDRNLYQLLVLEHAHHVGVAVHVEQRHLDAAVRSVTIDPQACARGDDDRVIVVIQIWIDGPPEDR